MVSPVQEVRDDGCAAFKSAEDGTKIPENQ
jgi:hypothetical protein